VRFVLAIVASVIAAVLIALGIGQRTIWAPPDTVRAEAAVAGSAPYLVIGGAVLGSNPGRQTITVSGDGELVLAYGRTSDVEGWVAGSDVTEIGYDEATTALTAEQASVPALTLDATAGEANAAIVDPRDSDLWYETRTGEGRISATLDLPEDVSVLIAGDGVGAAADSITISWPRDTSTPLAGPLLAGGVLFLVAGLVFFVLGFLHMRRQRGPRRRGPDGRAPRRRSFRYRPGSDAALGVPPRRDGRALIAVPVAGAVLLLSGCSADYWPDLASATSAPRRRPPTPPRRRRHRLSRRRRRRRSSPTSPGSRPTRTARAMRRCSRRGSPARRSGNGARCTRCRTAGRRRRSPRSPHRR
jgi:hypothetical protein